eukprot:7038303-Karenia_brevis.AAC.1
MGYKRKPPPVSWQCSPNIGQDVHGHRLGLRAKFERAKRSFLGTTPTMASVTTPVPTWVAPPQRHLIALGDGWMLHTRAPTSSHIASLNRYAALQTPSEADDENEAWEMDVDSDLGDEWTDDDRESFYGDDDTDV